MDVRYAPAWANGGNKPNWMPEKGADYANFVVAVHDRYPWVRDWLIWNEPNKAPFAHPVDPKLYVQRLLNPAYAALHSVDRSRARRGRRHRPTGGRERHVADRVPPRMRAAGAKLDAYAHNPYPERPQSESPTSGGCGRCATITMATLKKLLRLTQQAWPGKHIWLTEYAYQTNPPDRLSGCRMRRRRGHIGESACACTARRASTC